MNDTQLKLTKYEALRLERDAWKWVRDNPAHASSIAAMQAAIEALRIAQTHQLEHPRDILCSAALEVENSSVFNDRCVECPAAGIWGTHPLACMDNKEYSMLTSWSSNIDSRKQAIDAYIKQLDLRISTFKTINT